MPSESMIAAASLVGIHEFIDPMDFVTFFKRHDQNVDNKEDCHRDLSYLTRGNGWLRTSIYAKIGDARVWATGASVDIGFDCKSSEDHPHIHQLYPEVRLKWSSCGFLVASAYVAIQNYKNALDFAAKLEAFIAGRPIIIVDGV